MDCHCTIRSCLLISRSCARSASCADQFSQYQLLSCCGSTAALSISPAMFVVQAICMCCCMRINCSLTYHEKDVHIQNNAQAACESLNCLLGISPTAECCASLHTNSLNFCNLFVMSVCHIAYAECQGCNDEHERGGQHAAEQLSSPCGSCSGS